MRTFEVEAHSLEALTEAPDQIEDEGAIRDGFADVGEGGSQALELAAVVGDGEITLAEVVKLGVEVEGTSFTIAEKLGFNGKPGLPSSGTALMVASASSWEMVPWIQDLMT